MPHTASTCRHEGPCRSYCGPHMDGHQADGVYAAMVKRRPAAVIPTAELFAQVDTDDMWDVPDAYPDETHWMYPRGNL
jgi:hypothetical protein